MATFGGFSKSSAVRLFAPLAVACGVVTGTGSTAFAATSAAPTSAVASTPAASAPSATGPDGLSVYAACNSSVPANSDAAHGAYIAGKGSFDVGDYGTALAYFKDAYTRDCSKNELLVIIARAYELLPEKSVHNKKETLHALETYVERAPTADDTPRQKQRIERLKEDIASQEKQEQAAASAQGAAAAPADDSAAHHTIYPWIVAGGGAVVAITGVVIFAVGSSKVSDAESACPDHMCPAGSSFQSSGDSGNTLETVGGVMMAVGGAALIGGVVWHFLEPVAPKDSAASSTALAKFRFDPVVRPGYAGLGAVGTF